MSTATLLFATATATLQAFANTVLEDGVVDQDEVSQLKANIYADGTVEAGEVAVLVHIAATATSVDDSFADLYSQAVRDYAYADGSIDQTEATNIRTWFSGDGQYSDTEVRILNEILASGATMPEDFKTWATSVVNS